VSHQQTIERIRQLCMANNHSGVNLGAHRLAADVLSLIECGEYDRDGSELTALLDALVSDAGLAKSSLDE
jgi:hypothetical protein